MNNDPNREPTEEEIEELKEVMKKIEDLQKKDNNNNPKKPRNRFVAIEFGGFFHHNMIVNFIFTFIFNFSFAFFVIEIFNFANYNDIIYIVAMMFVYSIIEMYYRNYILMRQFPLVLKTFGMIFFFGYLLIFFILDQYVFIESFNFVNGTLLAFFVLFFTISRYIFSILLRNRFRNRNMR